MCFEYYKSRTIKSHVATMIVLLSFVCLWGCKATYLGFHKDRASLLRDRVEEYYGLWKSGKCSGCHYEFLLPQMRPVMSKKYLSIVRPPELTLDDYILEKVDVDGEVGLAVVQMTISYDGNILTDKQRFFTYWGFTQDNWYLLTDEESGPGDLHEVFKKVLKEEIPPEAIEEMKQNIPERLR